MIHRFLFRWGHVIIDRHHKSVAVAAPKCYLHLSFGDRGIEYERRTRRVR